MKIPAASSTWSFPRKTRYLLLEPWWRGLWFLLAIAWCIGLNLLWLGDSDRVVTYGFISVVPLLAFLADVLARERRISKASKKQR